MDLRDALIDWDEPGEPGGNTAHIAEHDLSRRRWSSHCSTTTRRST
jgi:hypothetical protein